MIEGYSVDEAASVLGVPRGRVWELLARGILAGTPEDGGGMRVFLQGRPMEPIVGRPPESRPGEPAGRPAGANGNGGEHGQPGFEASPFRELLTEFRNLTERYGQALLALGEARGEVASLRTRVELLEARIDLRLPPAPPLVQWSPPPQPIPQQPEALRDRMADALREPTAEVAADQSQAGDEPEAAADDLEGSSLAASISEEATSGVDEALAPPIVVEQAPAEAPVATPPRPRRRRQSARSATKGFSEALARAQDPTLSQLPGGQETQVASNELRERIRRESPTGETPDAADAFADEAEQAMGLGEIAAPAEEIELDALLADDQLGGGVQEATAIDEAILEPVEFLEEEPVPELAAMDQEQQPAAEAVVSAEGEPISEEEVEPIEQAKAAAIPEGVAIAIEPAQATVEPEPDEAPADLRALEPIATDHEQETAPSEPIEQTVTPAPAAYSHEWDEPDWIAEEDVDWSAGEESEALREPVAMGESPEIGWDELPAATTEAPLEQTEHEGSEEDPGSGHAPQDLGSAEAAEPEPSEPLVDAADVESAPSPVAEASPTQAIAVERLESPSRPPNPAEPTDARADRPPNPGGMTAQSSEEELMWLGDEFRAGPAAWSAPGRTTTIPRPQAPPAEPTVSAAEDEALARLAVERGWDDEELHAIRSLLAQPVRASVDDQEDQTRLDALAPAPPQVLPRVPEAPRQTEETTIKEAEDDAARSTEVVEAEAREEEAFDWEQGPSAWNPPPKAAASLELPGAAELDQAMAAFEVGAWSKETATHDDPRPGDESALRDDAARAEQPPPARQPVSSVDPAEPSVGDADWLRGRRGPAASAYRRLRRLFP